MGELAVFLFKAFVISLSGVLAPGPMTAAAVGHGVRSRHAGALMAVGHAVVEFPLSSVADLEQVEGMLATFPQDLVISEYFNYDRFGEVVVALPAPGQTRPMIPTAVEIACRVLRTPSGGLIQPP